MQVKFHVAQFRVGPVLCGPSSVRAQFHTGPVPCGPSSGGPSSGGPSSGGPSSGGPSSGGPSSGVTQLAAKRSQSTIRVVSQKATLTQSPKSVYDA
jgi:hypothetical protein